MEWRMEIYGNLNPSRAHRISLNALLGSALLCAYGMLTDFVPAPLVANVGTYVAVAVSLLLSFFIWRGYATGRIPWHKRPRLIARLLCYAVIPLGIYCFAWMIVVRAAPDIATRIFGTQASQVMILEASYRSRRKACDHQLRSPELGFPGHLCVSANEFNFAPRGAVVLSGKATMLGMHVTHIKPAPSQSIHAL